MFAQHGTVRTSIESTVLLLYNCSTLLLNRNSCRTWYEYQLLIAFHWGRAFHCTFKKCWICVISLQRTNQIAWNFLWCFVRFCLAYINGQYAYALWWTADMILGKSPLPKLAKFPVQTFFIGHALRNYSEYSLVYSNNYAVKTWIARKWTETRKKK